MTGGRAFLDASGWIALRDGREPFHSRARGVVAGLLRQRCHLVFTSLVLAETYACFARSPRIRLQILDDAERNPAMRNEWVSPADQTEAFRLLRQHGDKTFSYCDAVSFVVMQRLKILRVVTFDDHFRQFSGFEVLG